MTPYGTFIETRCVSVTTPSSDALTDDDEIVGVWGVGPFSTLRGRRDDCVESFSFVFRDSLLCAGSAFTLFNARCIKKRVVVQSEFLL